MVAGLDAKRATNICITLCNMQVLDGSL